jgi:hypothetical protein
LPGANEASIGGVERAEPQTIRRGGFNGMDCPAQHSTTGPGIADQGLPPCPVFKGMGFREGGMFVVPKANSAAALSPPVAT